MRRGRRTAERERTVRRGEINRRVRRKRGEGWGRREGMRRGRRGEVMEGGERQSCSMNNMREDVGTCDHLSY